MPDDVLVTLSAMFDVPTVIVERIPKETEALAAFEVLETHLRQETYVAMNIKANGLNSIAPITIVAMLGLSLMNADDMGRMLPEM